LRHRATQSPVRNKLCLLGGSNPLATWQIQHWALVVCRLDVWLVFQGGGFDSLVDTVRHCDGYRHQFSSVVCWFRLSRSPRPSRGWRWRR